MRMAMQTRSHLSIRIDLPTGGRIGPGKVALLEEIERSGSISAAARAMAMSYSRAWQLVENLNGALAEPMVETAAGGTRGGGARLTEAGRTLVREYRALERAAAESAKAHLSGLDKLALRQTPASEEP
jgi:molybdate transport system regulatory protein